jgi:predicted MFS family arabinose efflux permease
MDFIPAELRASGIGWYAATIGIFNLIASIVAGLLWDNISHEAVFIYGAILAAIASFALLLLLPKQN